MDSDCFCFALFDFFRFQSAITINLKMPFAVFFFNCHDDKFSVSISDLFSVLELPDRINPDIIRQSFINLTLKDLKRDRHSPTFIFYIIEKRFKGRTNLFASLQNVVVGRQIGGGFRIEIRHFFQIQRAISLAELTVDAANFFVRSDIFFPKRVRAIGNLPKLPKEKIK